MTISHDTVGAVALDRNGNIAAATSTGGTLNKAPGRLGDSSLIGCGCYANNESAAVSTTGWGEPIMKLVLAKWTADRIQAGNLPEWSAQEAMNYLKQRLERPRRHHRPQPRRPLRHRPQHSAHGLGLQDHEEARRRRGTRRLARLVTSVNCSSPATVF